MDAIRREATELAEALSRVGTAAYQGAASAPPESEDGSGPAPEAEQPPEEEAVEGEYKEV